jgi:hypothetical protein
MKLGPTSDRGHEETQKVQWEAARSGAATSCSPGMGPTSAGLVRARSGSPMRERVRP